MAPSTRRPFLFGVLAGVIITGLVATSRAYLIDRLHSDELAAIKDEAWSCRQANFNFDLRSVALNDFLQMKNMGPVDDPNDIRKELHKLHDPFYKFRRRVLRPGNE